MGQDQRQVSVALSSEGNDVKGEVLDHILEMEDDDKKKVPETDTLSEVIDACHIKMKEVKTRKGAKQWLKDPRLYMVSPYKE